MKQALHIFLKDAHRLRLQIAVLMAAIAYFAVLDVRGPGNVGGSGSLVIELITGAAAWLLIARAVHEESLPGDDQFWLTRPYERRKLLAAKIMMAVLVVGVPLFVADCIILSIQSLTVTGNLWGLLLRQLVTAAWLILPPFAIASITRTIAEDVMVWLALLTLGGLTYFPGVMNVANDFRASNERYALVCGLGLIVAAVWLQYSRRGTTASRAMLAAAILLPALPFPESAALAIDELGSNAAETSNISLAPRVDSIVAPPAAGYSSDNSCAPIPLSVGGVRAGWRLAVLSQNDALEANGKTWRSGWHEARLGAWEFGREAAVGMVSACVNSAGLRELGAGPVAVHVSMALAVFAAQAPVRVKATMEPFDVQGIGRCQFKPYLEGSHALFCKAPVWFPPVGKVAVRGAESWSSAISGSEYPWMPLNLLPGMSPVYKWVTMPMNDGEPEGLFARFGLNSVIQAGGEIEFRPETRIAVLRREVAVRAARFQVGN